MKLADIAKQYGVDSAAFATWLQGSSYTWKTKPLGGTDVDESQDIAQIVKEFQAHHAQEQERMAREAAERMAQQAQEHERLASKAAEREAQRARDEAARVAAVQQKEQALASMLVTSGFNFDGFTITKYSGYISGDDVVQIERGTSGFFSRAADVGAEMMASLVHIRRNALAELKEAAYALGCNAVIGVDFDYLTLDPETATSQGGTMYLPYVFGVTANGNAVVIEKNERTGL